MKTTSSNKFVQYKKKSYYLVSEKAQKAARFRLLKLAMDWNCVDVAREFIFKNSLSNILVTVSIRCCYLESENLFLETGINLSRSIKKELSDVCL